MKYFYIILAALTISSCSKRECGCDIITESNYDDAIDFCEGFANSYPNDYEVIISQPSLSVDCRDDGKLLIESYHEACNGVEYTVRTRIECK